MVNKLLRFLAFTLFFMLALMYFTPKLSIYYFAEEMLKEYGVVVSKEELADNGLSFKLSHGVVSYKGIDSANIEELQITLFGVYNALSADGVVLSSAAAAFVPLKVEQIALRYSVLNPLNALASAQGEFGSAKLEYNIVEKNLHIVLEPSKLMLQKYQSTLAKLSKNEAGEYVYDKTF
jgi:hypothetical protein